MIRNHIFENTETQTFDAYGALLCLKEFESCFQYQRTGRNNICSLWVHIVILNYIFDRAIQDFLPYGINYLAIQFKEMDFGIIKFSDILINRSYSSRRSGNGIKMLIDRIEFNSFEILI